MELELSPIATANGRHAIIKSLLQTSS